MGIFDRTHKETRRETQEYKVLRLRYLTPGGTGVRQAATGTAVVVTLPRLEQDVNYGVLLTPTWGTTCWVTARSTTQFTANFGTAPGGSDTFDWIVFRKES